MKKTRNLFLLVGSPADTPKALEAIKFKGLITVPYWTPCLPLDVEKAFKNNKSVVCSRDDFVGKIPKNAVIVNVVPTARSHVCSLRQTIYLRYSESIANQFEKIANDLNLDIGDHKSNTSGLFDGPTKKDCAYCQYLDGNIQKNKRTVYRSSNFFVIPTLGQFITGYLLIIPDQHIMSNGELSPEHLEEFKNVLEDVEYILKLAYPGYKILVWENGSGSSGKGKAKDSLVHSHVHVAPSALTSNDIKEISGFDFDEINLFDLPKYKDHSYLLIKNPDNEKWIINNNPEVYIPRQYVRQLIAEEYEIPGDAWNWRTHPFEDKMYQTIDDIITVIWKNRDQLPERIRNNTNFLFDAN
ncbi:MAG: hypothetical protein IJW20_05150 [Clostridia bacterium]|nr:hypothetical protein [Clostridia bacterium]